MKRITFLMVAMTCLISMSFAGTSTDLTGTQETFIQDEVCQVELATDNVVYEISTQYTIPSYKVSILPIIKVVTFLPEGNLLIVTVSNMAERPPLLTRRKSRYPVRHTLSQTSRNTDNSNKQTYQFGSSYRYIQLK